MLPVDSELFHQAALDRRLEQLRAETPSSQSDSFQLDQTLTNNSNKKFNLNQFLQNSLYPAEWTMNETIDFGERSILNASNMIDHLSRSTLATSNTPSDDWKFDANDTIVDEELILSLSQKVSNATLLNETLNENEHEVLDIFELMEEDEPTHDDTFRVDNDSALGPFSQNEAAQPKENYLTAFEEDDSDDELMNAFSMSILDNETTDR